MNNVVSMFEVKKSHKAQKTVKVESTPQSRGYDFVQIILGEIDTLAGSLNLSREDAIKVAKDFYRKYPMLIEYIREPNNLLSTEATCLEKLISTDNQKH